MQNLYFDIKWFTKIMDNRDKDPYRTIENFERYFEKYPKDYSAYAYYCTELIKIGNLKKAEEIYNMVEEEYKNNTKYIEYEKSNIFYPKLIYAKIKLLSYSGKYEECLDICKKDYNILYKDGTRLNRLIVYCEKKLNILKLTRKPEGVQTYSYNQIIEYQENDFLKHISKHLYENINEENCLDECYFSKDFPLNKALKIIKEITPNERKINNGLFDNNYYYKLDRCGIVNGKSVDYFVVITLDNTDEFITMYPVDIGPKMPHYDLNYLLVEEKPKTLVKSRIDKFNEKYGINVDKK